MIRSFLELVWNTGKFAVVFHSYIRVLTAAITGVNSCTIATELGIIRLAKEKHIDQDEAVKRPLVNETRSRKAAEPGTGVHSPGIRKVKNYKLGGSRAGIVNTRRKQDSRITNTRPAIEPK